MSAHLSGAELADLTRGLLSDASAANAREHLQTCERCSEARVRVDEGLTGMAQIAQQVGPDLSWDHIGARVYWSTSSEHRARQRGQGAFSRRWRYGLAGVSIAAAAAAAILIYGIGGHSEATESLSPTAPAKHVVAAAEAPIPVQTQTVGLAPRQELEGIVVLAQGPVLSHGQSIDLDELVVAGASFETAEGRLVVQFGGDSAFRIAPHSTLVIDRFDSERIALRIVGRVDVDITRRLPGQEFAVIAGTHEVQVRGTAFRVDYKAGDLGVECIRGKVVVTDGDRGVHVPAGQRFEIMRDALHDAALRALPMDGDALAKLSHAMQMPMMRSWREPSQIVSSTALLDLDSGTGAAIAVDGSYIADGAFTLRAPAGLHEVALVDTYGDAGKGHWIDGQAGKHTRSRFAPSSRSISSVRGPRKQQLRVAMKSSKRATRCLGQLAKHGLLKGSYLSLDIGFNKDGTQRFLNLLESNLSPAIQTCLRDAVDSVRLPPGDAASFQFRLSY